MLNYETLLSSYDDRLTLMQWLKKVEDALKDASAVSFDVVNYGNATLAFKIDFADGTSIESDKFVLQQGDSVESAAIVNGHLILTLTNGEEIDAGNMFDGNVDISGQLLVRGDIDAEGKISGAEIVESMHGYGFTPTAVANTTIVYNYVGIVKNGNKLTFVIDGKITPTSNTPFNANFASLTMPAAIISKLVPVDGVVAYGAVPCYTTTGSATPKSVGSNYYKAGSTALTLQFMSISPIAGILTADTTYRFRIEQTFLLSENLA